MVEITIKNDNGEIIKEYSLFQKPAIKNVYGLSDVEDKLDLMYIIGSKEKAKEFFSILEDIKNYSV